MVRAHRMIQVSIARLAECKWNTLVVIEEAVPASLLVFAAVGREEAGSVKVLAGFDLASVARLVQFRRDLLGDGLALILALSFRQVASLIVEVVGVLVPSCLDGLDGNGLLILGRWDGILEEILS